MSTKRANIIKKMPMTYEGTALEDFGKKSTALSLIAQEYDKAIAEHKPFHSAHEGAAIIKEEYDELWDEIKKKAAKRDPRKLQEEAAQLGAMALRFIVDVCMKDSMERRAGSGEKR